MPLSTSGRSPVSQAGSPGSVPGSGANWMWRSLEAHLAWDQGVGSSNLSIQTILVWTNGKSTPC